jgi:hypothetical protein
MLFELLPIGKLLILWKAYFTEGLGSPCLEYMLCSNAMRLACSKGLHRQAATSWGMTEQEICHRNWTFWGIYCLEKHIACRSGRPSVRNLRILTDGPRLTYNQDNGRQ